MCVLMMKELVDRNIKAFFVGSQHFSYFAVVLESVISYELPGGESAQYCMTNLSCHRTIFFIVY